MEEGGGVVGLKKMVVSITVWVVFIQLLKGFCTIFCNGNHQVIGPSCLGAQLRTKCPNGDFSLLTGLLP